MGSRKVATWDGMSEHNAYLAIDGDGKWVLADDYRTALAHARNAALEEAAALQDEEVRRLAFFARDSRCRDYICDAREAKDRAIAIRALKTDGGGDGI